MIDVVVPTLGRPSLAALLASLERAHGPRPGRIFLVDDRRERGAPLPLGSLEPGFAELVTVLPGRAAGPAAARNIGWRASRAQWVAFLDDDVVVDAGWLAALAHDLATLRPHVAASQGRVRVPLPAGRKPTDWERNVACLEDAPWITADCAYRRRDLLAVGGFDERFPRAYREDADLALRVVARGKSIVRGTRGVSHPVRPADWAVSVRLQAGNADDVLMETLHGRDWRERAGAPRGAYRAHVVTVTSAALALLGAAVWLARTLAFATRRLAPGPWTPRETATMALTSALIPFAAVYHRLRALLRLPATLADLERAPRPAPAAVLFDRDGTLIVDVPYNADPRRVEAMPGARDALERLRAAGIATAVVSNQSGVALGRLSLDDVAAVNARLDALLGPVGPVFFCTHAPADACGCRKPAPGLLRAAAAELGVELSECVVIGDIGADVEAARAAGAQAILVPTPVTLPEEVAGAPCVARDLEHAVRMLLGRRA